MTSIRITNAKELKDGDVFEFTCNGNGRGGHYNVTATVTKVNRKTVKAIERERSYRPGTRWCVAISEDFPVYKQVN